MDLFERVIVCLTMAGVMASVGLCSVVVKLCRELLRDFDGRLRRLEGRED